MLVRDLTAADARDPRKRQLVEFWNLVHALEHSGDVRLGVWLDSPPTLARAPVSSVPLAVLGWQGRSSPGWVTLPIDAVRREPRTLGTGVADDVVLARRSLPAEVFTALAEQYSYRPNLDGQEEGSWFFDGRAVPRNAPTSRSAVALLPEAVGRARGIRDGGECLVLVDIDDWWAVLSERALRVYDIGAALEDKRSVQFAQWTKGHRVLWDVELAPSISLAVAQRRFGRDAAERARPDAKSIVVRCSRSQ